jgi:hypothetical protein
MHHVVLYYDHKNNTPAHQSIVIISDTLAHNTETVAALLDNVLTDIKQSILSLLNTETNWTDIVEFL